VLWIRLGSLHTDPDPAFYLIADPDTDPDRKSQTPLRIQADPGLDQTVESQKVNFYFLQKKFRLKVKKTYRQSV
jgi:hypothetical protein